MTIHISRKNLEDYLATAKHAKNLQFSIEKRIQEVVDIIYQVFGLEKSKWTWYFPDAQEGNVGNLASGLYHEYDDELCLVIENLSYPQKPWSKLEIIDREGKKRNLAEAIPTRWIIDGEGFDLEKIAKEIEEGKILAENEVKDQQLLSGMFSRMSEEEKAALERWKKR